MRNQQDVGREGVTLALPSKGQLEEGTLRFLSSCGLHVSKVNPRQYQARMPAVPQVRVLFQRAEDIVTQVAGGTADLGITGMDLVAEEGQGGDGIVILHETLGYGHCDLVLAVPEGWLDVESVADLADMASEFRQGHGCDLRVATKFPNLARAFLYEHEIANFRVVPASGAIEAAPALGYADVVADLTATRTTLRENRLKEIAGGTVLRSQACFIGNRRALMDRPPVLEVARRMLEQMEAALGGRLYHTLTTNLGAGSPEELLKRLRTLLRGQETTVLSVAALPGTPATDPRWSVTLLAPEGRLMEIVDTLRQAGCGPVVARPVQYLFAEGGRATRSLLARLKRGRQER